MTRRIGVPVVVAAWLVAGCAPRPDPAAVRIGSKANTESAILGDLLAGLAESTGRAAEHRSPGGRRLGDTTIVWNSLLNGTLDAYADYTGTLTRETLVRENLVDDDALRAALARRGLRISRPLGFNSSYGLAMTEDKSQRLGVRTISDLRSQPDLRIGSTTHFVQRADAWDGLKTRYGLPLPTPVGMEQTLLYRALETGSVDVANVVTTDAEISYYRLRVLDDDLRYFPAYNAVILYRADLEDRAPDALDAMLRLEGRISNADMQAMNRRANIDKEPDEVVAADFLRERLGVAAVARVRPMAQRVWDRTVQHLMLVAVSLALGIVVAVPLGVLSAQRPVTGQVVLAAVGLAQTVPALALLSLLIVLFRRTGPVPAVAALFAYSLLPMVRNTYTGLHDVPLQARESAAALGLTAWARLRLVELPMASRAILAGVKTAAVLTVGFATLGGLVGAGGYGDAIVAGLQRNDTTLILEGAIPAMLMALAAQGLFEAIERCLVPRGLRLRTEAG
jgi:osmoprotectant transport system permease protein